MLVHASVKIYFVLLIRVVLRDGILADAIHYGVISSFTMLLDVHFC